MIMNTEQKILRDLVADAIRDFNIYEKYLLRNNLSERCICAKFATYLQERIRNSTFGDYIVDVEYNRGAKGKDYEPKRLANDNSPMTVDLIVHKRGYQANVHQHGVRKVIGFSNLICIEMKKSNDRRGKEGIAKDKERLCIMTRNYGGYAYSIGFMIIAEMKKHELIVDEIFTDEY